MTASAVIGNSEAAPNTLEGFCEQVRIHNPFLANRVDRPLTEPNMDVFGIHEAEFRKILNLGRQAFQDQRGIGVALLGEAGIGKSHLLARLGRWARERQQARFVYLHNLQVAPGQVPRGLLQAILGHLSNGGTPPHYKSPLFALVNSALRGILAERGQQSNNWNQVSDAYQDLVSQIAAKDPSRGVLFRRDVYEVLFRYFQAAYPSHQGRGDHLAELALRWLYGEMLTASEREQLHLRPESADENSGTHATQHAKQVLVALTQLAARSNQVFLLCLDQTDNLEDDQIRTLARFLHDLLDSAGNLLLLTAGVRETLLGFLRCGIITETSWDRIGQVEISLGRINKARGRELIWSRLQNVSTYARGLKEVEDLITKDALFPLGTEWFEERVRHLPDFRPRDLLSWAAERWQQHQEVLTTTPGPIWLARLAAADQAVQKVTVVDQGPETQAELNQTWTVTTSPPSADKLVELFARLLVHIRDSGQIPNLLEVQRVAGTGGAHPTYDVLLRQRIRPDAPPFRVGLRFLVTNNGQTTAAVLRRLSEDGTPPERVILVSDARQPLNLGTAGRKYLDQLWQRGPERFQHLTINSRELADIETLVADIPFDTDGSDPATDFEVIRNLLSPAALPGASFVLRLLNLSQGNEPSPGKRKG